MDFAEPGFGLVWSGPQCSFSLRLMFFILFWQFCPQRLALCREPVLLPAAFRPVRDRHFHQAALQRRNQVIGPEVILVPKAQCLLNPRATLPPSKDQHQLLDFPGDFPGHFWGGRQRVLGKKRNSTHRPVCS